MQGDDCRCRVGCDDPVLLPVLGEAWKQPQTGRGHRHWTGSSGWGRQGDSPASPATAHCNRPKSSGGSRPRCGDYPNCGLWLLQQRLLPHLLRLLLLQQRLDLGRGSWGSASSAQVPSSDGSWLPWRSKGSWWSWLPWRSKGTGWSAWSRQGSGRSPSMSL